MNDHARPLDIRHDEKRHTFKAVVDGHTCELDYRLEEIGRAHV